MIKQVAKANGEWERAAIEKCAADPEFMKLGLCPVCVCSHPCLCEQKPSDPKQDRTP